MIQFFASESSDILSTVLSNWDKFKEFMANGALILDNFYAVLPYPVSTVAALFTSISIIYLIAGRN